MNVLRAGVSCGVLIALALGKAPGAESPATPRRGDPRWLLPVPELKPDPRVPALADVVGHAWAEDITSHAEMERYLESLAKAASDRVAMVSYGKSYEGRRLGYLVITSPENLRRLESIRAANLALADPRATPPEKARSLAASVPAVVWIACCIHGNETSSPEAAMLAAYHMAADRRPETEALLRNVVFLLDPMQNPDGHERFVNAYREMRGPVPDPSPLASERTERWPGGRFNHYGFDMNRDWFLQSQRETLGKAAAYLRWQPHLYCDAHEMGHDATYYFVPPAGPRNPLVLPFQVEWLERLGRHLGGRFDERGFAYTTREMFDDFFPGYGSSWPLFHGALGVLWEQAGVRGLVVDRSDETQLALHDAVRHHYTSMIATIEFAAQNRQRLAQDFYEARLRGIQQGKEGPVRHYFLLAQRHPDRAADLAALLGRNGVEVRRVSAPVEVVATSARTGQKRRQTVPAGSYHIPLAQPASRLARALLDRHVDMGREFVNRQLQRKQQRFPDEIYDVTAWSLPLAFDVECLATGDVVEVKSRPGDAILPPGEIVGGKAKVAYLVPGSDRAMRALAVWLRQGLRVHVADQPFRLEKEDFARGTLILRTAENPEDLAARLEESAKRFGLRIHAAQTGFVTEGAHFGGPHVRWVRPPKVVLLVDQPARYTVGHTWHLFDQSLGYPVTRVAGRHLGRLDLTKYNVLILPDGDYGGAGAPGEKEIARWKSWISEGGTLIAIQGAAAWAADKKVGLLRSQVRKKPGVGEPAALGKRPSEAPAEESGEPPDPVPGAFLRATVFEEHWLTFGLGDSLDVFRKGNLMLVPPAAKGRSVVTFAGRDQLLSSGFCWPETLALAAETSYLIHQPLGEGHVVAFADDPNYRAMYPALQRLFINAVMFGPGH